MKFSKEQKELLNVIHELAYDGDSEPKTVEFLTVLSKIAPKHCFMQFGEEINGFRYWICDDDIKDDLDVHSQLLRRVITLLDLLSYLESERMMISYQYREGVNFKHNLIWVDDCEGNKALSDPRIKLISASKTPYVNSPTVWELMANYANSAIQPSFTLIQIVRNDFKTEEQVLNEQNLSIALESLNDGKSALRKSTRSIHYAITAIFISFIVGVWGIVLAYNGNAISRAELDVDKQELEIDRESLDFSKLSSTEEKQKETNDLINSNNELISIMTATIDSLRIEVRNLQLKKRGK